MDMETQGILYTVLKEVEPPSRLSAAIRARIAEAARRSARTKTLWLGIASLVFGILLVPAVQYAGQELYASGFYEYASLFFSDSSSVLSAWRELSLSMIESLPSFALLLLLALAGGLVWLVRRMVMNARIAFSF